VGAYFQRAQHAFIDSVVSRYISEHSGTLAAKVLSVMKGS
jgi:hypothetical protein